MRMAQTYHQTRELCEQGLALPTPHSSLSTNYSALHNEFKIFVSSIAVLSVEKGVADHFD